MGASNTGVGVAGYCIGPPGPGPASEGEGVNDGVLGVGMNGVHAFSNSGGNGVLGESFDSNGVLGTSDYGAGVYGQNGSGGAEFASYRIAGVVGASSDNAGVLGLSDNSDGVKGISNSTQHAGVAALNVAPWNGTSVPSGFALWAQSNATGIWALGNPAGYFDGDVQVTGDVILVNPGSGDIAEDFDVDDQQTTLEPGTVLVIRPDGKLWASDAPYDTRVAGVVSGAGQLKPAVVLQRVSSARSRLPIALLGKVFCKVDATSGSITAGDLLTTSATPGHAMRVSDKSRALGAIIGKALACFEHGVGVIPIMVSLR